MTTFSAVTTASQMSKKLIEIAVIEAEKTGDLTSVSELFQVQLEKTLKSCKERDEILDKIFSPTDGLHGSGKSHL